MRAPNKRNQTSETSVGRLVGWASSNPSMGDSEYSLDRNLLGGVLLVLGHGGRKSRETKGERGERERRGGVVGKEREGGMGRRVVGWGVLSKYGSDPG